MRVSEQRAALLLALVAHAGTPLSGDIAHSLCVREASPRPRPARWRARRAGAPLEARPRLRGGSDGEEFATKADDMVLANVALIPRRRMNRTALDLAVYGDHGSELVADRINDASLFAQAGIDEEEIDRRMHEVLREYEDVDFSGTISCWVSRGPDEGGTAGQTPLPSMLCLFANGLLTDEDAIPLAPRRQKSAA